MDMSKASPWTHESFIKIAHVGQVRGEDNLPALCLRDPIRCVQKAMQRLIAVGARGDQVIGILDQERIMLASDELDEDLIALPDDPVARVERHRMRVLLWVLAQRHLAQQPPDEAGLAHAGWPL